MQNNTIGLGLNLLSNLTNTTKIDAIIDHNYINTFSKVIDFFYKIYIRTPKSMEAAESMYKNKWFINLSIFTSFKDIYMLFHDFIAVFF
ncbi:BlyB family putative holin accessory protein (plasmid) [Borreliella burgdorferi]|uniref:Uncharacterized protein n=1 Tax=Borreliella burgdorferi 118a TaxID=476210 RepID=A0A7U3YB28_BORBG|nr:BlyB family putative holin accessory protein [Borreliella burgdorferi]ACM10354.1 hypothetical protein BBU72A_S0002 [Borreliella burgdorferi 72a]ACN92781.1 hypothetical protein BBU118A_S04 [Borreliella burgdorferi 118a]